MVSKIALAATIIGFAAFIPAARADLLTTLSYDGCTGTCGTPPFGTVDLTQVTMTEVLVTETLVDDEGFVSTGAGEALQFNITGDPTISVSNLTSGFSSVAAPAHNGGNIGTFDYAIDCSGCGSGGSAPLSGPLSFDVTVASGLSANDFAVNSSGFYFASDILGNNGKTGNVGANTAPVVTGGVKPVQEPTEIILLPSLLGALWLLRRRSLNPSLTQ